MIGITLEIGSVSTLAHCAINPIANGDYEKLPYRIINQQNIE